MYKKLKEPKKKKIIVDDSQKKMKIEMIKKLKINPLLKWIYIRDIK